MIRGKESTRAACSKCSTRQNTAGAFLSSSQTRDSHDTHDTHIPPIDTTDDDDTINDNDNDSDSDSLQQGLTIA